VAVAAEGNGGILVVDDDAGFRALVSSLLEGEGVELREVASGEEALEAAKREKPRLVVLDVCLPRISGYEVCRALKDFYGDGVSIIFVSGERCAPLDRAAGLLLGADDYLAKPFSPDEFLARVRRLLPRTTGVLSILTRREREVLQLLADDLHQKEIAQRLVLSPKTIATHVDRIYKKLNVHSRDDAIAVGRAATTDRRGAL